MRRKVKKMENIEQIVDDNFRSGTGKKGQPWSLMKITTNTGKQATVFAPAQIGDPVELEYNEQYKSYSAKVMTGKKMEAVVQEEKKEEQLQEINDKLDKILKYVEPQQSEEEIIPF